VRGLGWLDVTTKFAATKTTRQRRGVAMGQRAAGYEIHHGRVARLAGTPGWVHLDDAWGTEDDGAVEPQEASVLGTSLHGLFEQDGFRAAFLCEVGRRAEKTFVPAGVSFSAGREAQIDRLADALEAHLDLAALDQIVAEGAPVP
jgi:adenosylcobyric acid synthase